MVHRTPRFRNRTSNDIATITIPFQNRQARPGLSCNKETDAPTPFPPFPFGIMAKRFFIVWWDNAPKAHVSHAIICRLVQAVTWSTRWTWKSTRRKLFLKPKKKRENVVVDHKMTKVPVLTGSCQQFIWGRYYVDGNDRICGDQLKLPYMIGKIYANDERSNYTVLNAHRKWRAGLLACIPEHSNKSNAECAYHWHQQQQGYVQSSTHRASFPVPLLAYLADCSNESLRVATS